MNQIVFTFMPVAHTHVFFVFWFGFCFSYLLSFSQVNNATARVMTNKKVANPYTNGKSFFYTFSGPKCISTLKMYNIYQTKQHMERERKKETAKKDAFVRFLDLVAIYFNQLL